MKATSAIKYLFALSALVITLSGCAVLQNFGQGSPAHGTKNASAEPPPPDATSEQPVVYWQDIEIKNAPAPKNIWAVMRKDFTLIDHISNRRVAAERKWYVEHPGYMQRTAERAKPYLYYVVQQVKKRGMPMELALLPIVESAYDPFAYSNGRASGLWQFIPSTGERYDLRQNWWYDGRRDIAASTKAALDFLNRLHEKFHGSWLLALAAYNSGSGTVQAAIDYNRRHHRPTDFWHLRLPIQTRDYVPRLLAVSQIINDPSKYHLQLPFIANAPYLAKVTLHGQIDLALAAHIAGISLKKLYLLNPGYNRWATPPSGTSHLFIPLDKKAKFETAINQMNKKIEVKWVAHRIRPGESLRELARRYHTTVAELRSRNHLHGNTIIAGHLLMVPSASQHYTRYTLSASMRLAKIQGRAHSNDRRVIHVRAGETLWGLSRHYGVSIADLAKWNGMAPNDPLHVGQRLVIWSHQHIAANSGRNYPVHTIRRIRYIVHRGDSLSSISNRFNVSVNQIADWNSLNKDSIIHPGQLLTLFVDVRNQS